MKKHTVENLVKNVSYIFVNNLNAIENLITVVLLENHNTCVWIGQEELVAKIRSEIVEGEKTYAHGNWCVLKDIASQCRVRTENGWQTRKHHSFAWSGEMPCTGVYRCVYCGYAPEDKQRKVG